MAWLKRIFAEEPNKSIPYVKPFGINFISHMYRDSKAVRVFFVTIGGRFDLGPLSAREGDEVVVLYGASVPFVVRPGPENGRELIGECNVHGLMHGEALAGGHEE